MAVSKLSQEYSSVKSTLTNASFAGTLAVPMRDLCGILLDEGPKSSLGPKLDALRTISLSRNESERILESAGLAAGSNTVPGDDAVKKVTAVKFLRHLHMLASSGSQTVWIHSSPKVYRKFITDELADAKASVSLLKAKLDKKTEMFDTTTKQHLAEAMRVGATWVQKALIALAAVGTDAAAKEKLDRWFAPAADDQDDLVKKLTAGFKQIQGTLNKNQIIITDMPIYRGDSSKDLVEAFVKAATETPKTIYIGEALNKNFDVSVLHDMKKNWARTLVHECSHIEAKTKDRGYAFQGIGPGTKITPANAAINADTWAFFAADCGGALVQNDITRALTGTGGTLTQLPKNWN